MGKKSSTDRSLPPVPQPLPGPVGDAHCHLDLTRNDLADTGGITPSGADQPNRGAAAAQLLAADNPSTAAGHATAPGAQPTETTPTTTVGPGEQPPEPLSAEQALALAAQVNVTKVVHIGCEVESSRYGVALSAKHPAVAAAVALHPNEAPTLAKAGQLEQALDQIEEMLSAHPKVRALGETGLDYFRTAEQDRPAQHESFRAHIEMAKRHNKSLAIHDRDAHEDIINTLLEVGPPERVIFHCYSGDADMAKLCARQGWFLSFAGNFTFGNAQMLRDALAVVPDELLLVETDAPFLTPAPYRGRPNASYLIPVTVQAMAQVRGQDLEQLCEHLSANTFAAYGGPW